MSDFVSRGPIRKEILAQHYLAIYITSFHYIFVQMVQCHTYSNTGFLSKVSLYVITYGKKLR